MIFALENPTPNLTLLDRFLVMMEQQNVPTAIFSIKEILRGKITQTICEASMRTAVTVSLR